MNVPGGYCWEFVVGVCHPVLQILDQKVVFSTPVSRPILVKSIPVFRPGVG